MARSLSRSAIRSAIVLVAAIVVWFIDQRQQPGKTSGREIPSAPAGRPGSVPTSSTANPSQEGRYQKYTGCKLVDHRQNDGDSFRVELPGGRVEQFRLYFVDCPESAFRTYNGGANNRERIDDQARYFRITPEQAVAVGQQAKELTHRLLSEGSFTVYTAWEDPFGDKRFHAVVALSDGRWLHEELVRSGLVRIFTKPAEMPDGTPAKEEVAELRQLEDAAKGAHVGGWALSQ